MISLGNAKSKNVVNSTMTALTNMSNTVVQENLSTQKNSMVLDISDTSQDVVISGNEFTQTNSVNMNSVNSSQSSQTAQNQLEQDITQVAYAFNSGINLLQSSDAENFITTYMSSTINISNNVSQMCSSEQENIIDVNVNHTDGNVYVINNKTWQNNEANTRCLQKAISSQDGINAMQNHLSQVAIAKNVGITMWALVACLFLLACIIIVPEMVVLYEGEEMLLYAPGGILALVGLIFLVIWLFSGDDAFIWYGYSVGISNDPNCSAEFQPTGDPAPYDTMDQAQKDALKQNADAIDYKFDLNADGSTEDSGMATFYTYSGPKTKDMSEQCTNIISLTPPASLPKTNQPGFVDPKFNQGPNDPTAAGANISGDIYLNTNTGQLWVKAITGIGVGSPRNKHNPPQPGNYAWMTWRDAAVIYKEEADAPGWIPPDEHLSFTYNGNHPVGIVIPYNFAYKSDGSANNNFKYGTNNIYFLIDKEDDLWVPTRDDGVSENTDEVHINNYDLFIDVRPFLPTVSCTTESGCFLGWYWCNCDTTYGDNNCSIVCTCNCPSDGSCGTTAAPTGCACCCSGGCVDNQEGGGNQTYVKNMYFGQFILYQNTSGSQTLNVTKMQVKGDVPYEDYIAVVSGPGRKPQTQSTLWSAFLYKQKNSTMLWVAIAMIAGGMAVQIIMVLILNINKKSNAKTPTPTPTPTTTSTTKTT